ncbi:AraC family transcriptional regulator [Sphingopyxis sp. BSN-002]|uniref:helix-turn-helix transcriptional regulator n=1 Tax=Sphingopyxis sp. BSN-002 TaxID=2911495 RepID=UPI001ED9C840|nr:AraC family transcriptional regulator [Sphingopyxis sp. BSN-002]UKK82875.1 AraC family transcriptional regulator [Sphingopyxis sp. BSN-002]
METIDLPLEDLPRIAVAGQFLLADRGFSTIHQGRTHALHLHGYTGEMELAGKRIRIAPGDITLSPAGLPSSYDLAAPGTHWCIHIEAGEGQGAHAPVALHLPDCAALRERFAHVSGLFATASDPIAHIAARLAAQELLLTLARRTDPLPEDDAAARAAEYIDRHFHEAIGVREIAAAAGRSPAYLARLFRSRFGTTVPHRLLQRRAEHARFLLESTDLPIWRVAERCGVADAQRFNKMVRSLLGASPSAVRARVRGPVVDPDR